MAVLFLTLLFIAFLARWVISAWGSGTPEIEARHTAEIARLREEMDQLAAQVLRLQDEQTFMTRLLTDGSGRGAEALPPEVAAQPENPDPENP